MSALSLLIFLVGSRKLLFFFLLNMICCFLFLLQWPLVPLVPVPLPLVCSFPDLCMWHLMHWLNYVDFFLLAHIWIIKGTKKMKKEEIECLAVVLLPFFSLFLYNLFHVMFLFLNCNPFFVLEHCGEGRPSFLVVWSWDRLFIRFCIPYIRIFERGNKRPPTHIFSWVHAINILWLWWMKRASKSCHGS